MQRVIGEFFFVADADKRQGARRVFAEEGKILAAHHFFDGSGNSVAIQLVQRRGGDLRDLRIVDQGRRDGDVFHLSLGAEGGGGVLDDPLDGRRQNFADLMAEAAGGPFQRYFVAGDVPAGSTGQFADRDDCGLERSDFAAAHRLEVHDDGGSSQDGVDPLVRHRAVACFSPNGNLQFIGGSHAGPGHHRHFAAGQIGPEVKPQNRIDILHDSGFQHF